MGLFAVIPKFFPLFHLARATFPHRGRLSNAELDGEQSETLIYAIGI